MIRLYEGKHNHDDVDSTSERDFLCPPKRRRQDLFCFNNNSSNLSTAIDSNDLHLQLVTSSAKLNNPHKIRLDALIDDADLKKR